MLCINILNTYSGDFKLIKSLNLKQLRLLEAVDRLGNLSLAAKELRLSQPAVSIQMKGLQEAVGVPLIEKINKRIHLTAAGQKTLSAAKDIIGRISTLGVEIEEMESDVAGPLDIAVVTSAKYILPHFLGEFVRLFPKVRPRLTVTNKASVLAAIANYEHDLYITGELPSEINVEAHPFLDNILAVAAAPNHPLAGKKNIPLKALENERMLVREIGSGTRMLIDKVLAKEGVIVKPYMELGSDAAITNGVIAGLGISVLSIHNLKYERASNVITTLDVQGFPLRRPWFAVHGSQKHLSTAPRAFLDFLRNHAEVNKSNGQLTPKLAD